MDINYRKLPDRFEYSCSKCPTTHIQEGSGTYTQQTPPGWVSVRIFAPDVGLKELLLCSNCKDLIQRILD